MSTGTICFIPCSNSKIAIKAKMECASSWFEEDSFRQMLVTGRQAMKPYIKAGAPLSEAFNLYSGFFYRVLDKKCISEKIQTGNLRVFIISAGYGIVASHELIQDYDAMMAGPIASTWKKANLTKIISDIIQKYQPAKAFGFFSGETTWGQPSSKYRYFYSNGIRQALSEGWKPVETGCFYRAEGKGTVPILSALGLCFTKAVSSDFSNEFIKTAMETGFKSEQYPSILVKYDRFYNGGI